MINAISPIDGRYAAKTAELNEFYSESALIKYRIFVEIEYLIHLSKLEILPNSENINVEKLRSIYEKYSDLGGETVKQIERKTNHDVKAVEYYIKDQAKDLLHSNQLEFVHFGLTSQDINNTALPLMVKGSLDKVIIPLLTDVIAQIQKLGQSTLTQPMLARTHGQPASPTTLGKELLVYVERLDYQMEILKRHQFFAKFGGATGNFNAHLLAYPKINWRKEISSFIESIGLKRHTTTTQIAHYDDLAECFQTLSRINTILIDFCRDIWTYISINYFGQKVVAGEVGSSAMPHKVNPIDFENAEGNLGIATALLNFLANKLPISRLQRDLTDSTVTRNIGVPIGHIVIAAKSLQKGINKLKVNKLVIDQDLTNAWAVVAEGIQTILRREGFEKPYELLRDFSRGKGPMTKSDFDSFIETLNVSDEIRAQLLAITPHNFIGYAMDRNT